MRKNDEATVGITDMNSLGYGVGHIDGKAVFVPDAAPGDLLRVLVIKDGGRYFVGKRLEILRASDLRVASACPAFPRCGGCAFRHITYEAEKRVKENLVRGFLKKEGLDLEVLPLLSAYDGRGYRNKIQYPSRDGKLGYFAPHSHRVIENGGCALHRPEAERVIAALRAFFTDHPVASYDETAGKGLLRHLCLRTDRRGENMLLTLVVNGKSYPYEKELTAFLQSKCPAVKGLYLNINQKNTNVIFGEEFKLLWGQPTITDELLSCSFEIGPASFYQVYPEGCEILYREVVARADLKGGEKIVDLFCGVGTIGVCLLKHAPAGCSLAGIEIVPEAVENARRSAARNGVENAAFFCGDANHPALSDADVVIVDPPRKGLEEALISHLSSLEALKKIVYVSCGPDTLARDLARFAARGWTAGPVQPVDMFPRTGHVETVVQLSRQ